ncbi:COP9 signalosome complex subunit 1 [Cladorrhinum samala]|uniref:COP9 signalosome complex subunit 1 n=1 Tax=Cladorrhinum samala TaxID=585594 RepID=A0AAV9H9K5_9PEZI|nr:COP9 signalosome complex subunit 1 [Cladorrhinum samala]
MADPLLQFFTQMDNLGIVVVKDAPKLDLDLYIQNYRGRTRFDRLFLIGRSSVTLCIDALKAAIAEAKRGRDTQRYRDAVECLRIASPSDPEANFDQKWLEQQEVANRAETARLQAELKVYKNNLIKESIRMGHEDLGKHLESTGDLNGAADAYSKMRPDISQVKHLIDVGKHLIRVSIQRREWAMINAHLAKMTFAGQYPEEEKATQPYMSIARGIAYLGSGEYYSAAICFLGADSNINLSATYADIASRNDVAIYGGLLALASMDRDELQREVLDNSSFRVFLELEPHLRRAITMFVNGRYSSCIEILEAYRPDYLLDIYLQKHISTIYAKIRSKCIVQYLIPFSRVSLDTISKAFGSPEQSIEQELAAMIQEGTLKGRINLIDRLITTVRADPRSRMQSDALYAAEDYERQAIERLRRMSLAAADLELKGPKKNTLPSMSGSNDFLDFVEEQKIAF